MRYRTFMILSALLPMLLHAGQTSSITRNGITWTFDTTYETGRFVNGDPWVRGPVNVVAVDPPSSNGRNGSMLDPVPGSGQGYHANAYGYQAALNAATGISAGTPLHINPGSRLVSSVSPTAARISAHPGWYWMDPDDFRTDCVWAAAVLTVVAAAPATNSFRPGYCDAAFTVFSADDLQTDLLRNVPLPAGTDVPSYTEMASWFEHPWIDHKAGWSGSHIHPQAQMPFYGREISGAVGTAALALHLDRPLSDKMELLYRFVQYGIDMYSIISAGGTGTWTPDGGHASGRKWPILFAGLLLDDAGMKGIGAKSGDYAYAGGHGPADLPPDYLQFGEDGQTFFITQADVERTHSDSWAPDTRATEQWPYAAADIGLPEWGIRHTTNPYADNLHWSATYRTCCTAKAWPGWILAAHIMGARTLWNHDTLFDYMDRYMPVDPDYAGRDFISRMWHTHRREYGGTWVRDDAGDIYSGGGVENAGMDERGNPPAKGNGFILHNPVRNTLRIAPGTDAGNGLLRLFDVQGAVVRNAVPVNGTYRLDVSALPAGVYHIRTDDGAAAACIIR